MSALDEFVYPRPSNLNLALATNDTNMSGESTQGPKFFGKPFDDDDADLILQSSDGLYFRVYKVLLAKASPVFKDMLLMPQDPSHDAVQVVQLAEDGKILEKLLRLIYPVDGLGVAACKSLNDITNVFYACIKYQMEHLMERFEASLIKAIPTRPLFVYFLAYAARLEEVAKMAAKECLYDAMITISRADTAHLRFECLPSAKENLLCYFQECGQLISTLTSRRRDAWLYLNTDRIYVWVSTTSQMEYRHTCRTSKRISIAYFPEFPLLPADNYTRQWWEDYMDDVGHARFDRPILVKQLPILCSTGCPECDRDCASDMALFIPKLQDAILDRVSQVSGRQLNPRPLEIPCALSCHDHSYRGTSRFNYASSIEIS